MKKLLLAAVCCVLLLLSAGHVESRSHSDGTSDRRYSKLFVFGDEFVDTGNFPLADLGETTRAWYGPYGMNDVDHGSAASGRFSNGLVLSDLVARAIMGRKESPPPERQREDDGVDPSGMNFAVGGAGVAAAGMREAPKLGAQVDKFRRLVRHGIIGKDLAGSVALVAFSGRRDYYARAAGMSGSEAQAAAQDVTDKVADAVEQLLGLGVEKVLVATLPPVCCAPALTRPGGYEACDDAGGNRVASLHNAYLEEKVFGLKNVFNLDLKLAFNRLVADHGSSSRSSKQFKYKLEPCCESFDEAGYCGQMKDGEAQYSVCAKPDSHFYWDDTNPSQACWKAVMKELQESLKNFLDI